MAEDGIDDFALAKRKAARQLGVSETQSLPANDEIERELRSYRALYQPQEHAQRIAALRRAALDAMRALERFSPYLTGPVLAGTAGPYAEVDLQLFPESAKDVELFLLERQIGYASSEVRRYSGDRARVVGVFSLVWSGASLRISIFDQRDERLSLKTSPSGKVMTKAGIREVEAMLNDVKYG
jgi:Trm5-related predicted tRNA methylase